MRGLDSVGGIDGSVASDGLGGLDGIDASVGSDVIDGSVGLGGLDTSVALGGLGESSLQAKAGNVSEAAVFRSGFVTLIGRPNAGKSTLVNAVMGKKLSVVSDTPQTTRHRFRAVLTTDDYQLILVDTPGIHKPIDLLGEELNLSAFKALDSIDAIAFVLDATKAFGTGDEWILKAIEGHPAPRLLVVTKTDLCDEKTIARQVDAATGEYDFHEVIALSALTGKDVGHFIDSTVSLLPEGPRWFPSDTSTDQPIETIISEFIREKILISTFDEVPHAVGVQVEELSFDAKKGLYVISANIYVERNSQKGILIGARGERIKQVGTQARLDLEHFLGARVFLDLRVKVRKDWRKDANQIRRFGYGERA